MDRQAEHSTSAHDIISDSGALLELSNVLNSSTDLDFILGNILLTSMGKLLISRGVVLLEKEKQTYQIKSVKGLRTDHLHSTYFLPPGWEHAVEVTVLENSPDDAIRHFAACCRSCALEIIIPMLLDGRLVGVIGLGGKVSNKPFLSADLTFLESVAAVAATAVKSALKIEELRQLNRRLDSKVQEMNTLFEISREMNTTFDPEDILRTLSYALMGQLRVLRYIVFTLENGTLRPVLTRLPDFVPHSEYQRALAGLRETLVFSEHRVPENPHEQWLHDAGLSTLIPMNTQHQLRGVLCLGQRIGGERFDTSELEYLHALANITISALENARLVKDTIERQRLEQELTVAKIIQNGLLPKALPSPSGYEVAAVNESSQQVGGDYYDVIALSAHEYVLAIADVAGKGVPAALLMANMQAALRTIAPLRLPLPDATARMNAVIHANTGVDKFITFFWGVLDTQAHTLSYVNAGHNPPYLLHADGSMRALTEGGLILGVLDPPPPYASETVSLTPGDTMVSYTDGVSEAMSKDMEEFGDETLRTLLQSNRSLSAHLLLESVRDEILAFTEGAQQSDDITMLIVRRLR